MIALADRTSVRTPKGRTALFEVRGGTSDAALVHGIIGGDEYGLADLPPLSGWAIDIGAHIGTVAVALALDHPDLHVIAVEALPENVESLTTNIGLNGLAGRVSAIHAAACSEDENGGLVPITYNWSRADNQPDGYMADNRFIGGMVEPNETSTTLGVPAMSLSLLLGEIAEVELLKIDCEGCEWFFLQSSDIARCKRIWGEFHIGRHGTAARLRELLEPTHDVEMDDTKVVGLFRATRR